MEYPVRVTFPQMTVLALDCGGSSIRSRIVDSDSSVVFEGASGPGNWASTPRETLQANLLQSLENSPKPDFALVCMAGLLSPQDREQASQLVRELSGARKSLAVPDYYATHASCSDPDAVCVLSGTGSMVCSARPDGTIAKSGGGGPLLGDWGSGYWVGRTALGRYLFPRDSAQPPESITATLAQVAIGASLDEMIASLYQEDRPATAIARFGSMVAQLATAGDEYAQGVIADSMQPLADLTIEHMRNEGFPQRKFKVYRTGGFWDASHYVVKYFEVLLRLPTHPPPLSPLEGAVLLAQQYAKA